MIYQMASGVYSKFQVQLNIGFSDTLHIVIIWPKILQALSQYPIYTDIQVITEIHTYTITHSDVIV